MTILHYLRDERRTLWTFAFILIFINAVILLDPESNIHPGSLLYMDMASVFLLGIHLCCTYFRKQKFLEQWTQYSNFGGTAALPKTTSFEEGIYVGAITKLNQKHTSDITHLNKEKQEWLEYITAWFHEIKTPIAVSRMLYETRGSITSLEEEMDKIEHFIEQALYFSRLNDFSNDYIIQEIDIEMALKDAIKANRKTFLSKRIKLDLHLASFEVLTDKKALIFIINQLLSNALKYTGMNGKILIIINAENRTMSICDNGIGIAAEDLPRVFQKGFTGKNGRKQHSSTGMGLYLAKRMAGKLGHDITIRSEEGNCTEAVISFPELHRSYYF
ncbi:sensor histidine kinase [Peribacillus sp. SCS-155]|uniref:sensor histidine kinase n=1 Tax=Peribacillus sedimenti TaxID=3115297 RepID=UPI003906823D